MLQRRLQTFFPWAAPIPRDARKSSIAIHRFAQALTGEAPFAFGRPIAIETAMVRARTRNQGELPWLPSAPSRSPAPTNSSARSSPFPSRPRTSASLPIAAPAARTLPSHRVFVGRVEIGAAWSKQSNEGRAYLGLKLDDPSFTAPIYANLFDDEEGDGFSLIWSRPNRRNGD
jgi:uncharacterized protein (DUF736 family)